MDEHPSVLFQGRILYAKCGDTGVREIKVSRSGREDREKETARGGGSQIKRNVQRGKSRGRSTPRGRTDKQGFRKRVALDEGNFAGKRGNRNGEIL